EELKANSPAVGLQKWIDNQHARRLEIPHISRHHVKSMTQRGGRDESVRGSQRVSPLLGCSGNLSPDAARLPIDRQQPLAVAALQPIEPILQTPPSRFAAA